MAFHDYHARDGNNFSEAASDQRPDLAPLNLELVPPVLCHSFGIPMHDAYFVPGANVYSYGYRVPGGMRPGDLHPAGFQGQFLNDAQLSHGGGLNFGVMPGDPNGYPQQGYLQARMYPYHPAFDQRSRQMPYPAANDMYNASLFRRADNGAMEMCMAANPGQMSGYDLVQQRQGISDGMSRGMKRTADQAASLNSEPGGLVPAQAHLEAVALKRTRLVWTPELHQRFEEAVLRAGGIEVAVPKTVLEYMNVDGLTRDNVASHLQKHRMHLKKGKSESKPASRSHSKPYTQPDAPATQSAKTCETTTRQERSQPSSPHCTAEGEATTLQIFTNDDAVAAKSHANFNFASITDEAGRAQGESSGDGTSGSGSGNSSSRNMTSVVLATPHSHTGSARDSRAMPSEAPTRSHVMVSFGNTGCSIGASNGTSKAAQARSSSQTNDVPRNGKSHNNSNDNSHPEPGQTRGSEVRDAGRVDDSNGTSATCGQSECDRPHES